MRIALAFLVAASTSGCLAHDPSGDDLDPTAPSHTTPPPPQPISANGTYQVRSDIDLTIEALLPEPAADLVSTFRDFETNPAHTLLDAAEDAGVPALGEIRDALPSVLEDELEGWMNSEIAKLTINGTPVTQIAGSIVDIAELALTHFAIDSELVISSGSATHTLKTLDLTPTGLDVAIDLADVPSSIVSATPSCSATDTAVSIGDHTYGLPYGEYMWMAFDAVFVARFGTDIYNTIAPAIDCGAIAHAVASKCIAGACVGHESTLRTLCYSAVVAAINEAYEQVSSLRMDAVHFAAGTATLIDSNGDHAADALANGIWTAEINAGQGLRHVPATFIATR